MGRTRLWFELAHSKTRLSSQLPADGYEHSRKHTILQPTTPNTHSSASTGLSLSSGSGTAGGCNRWLQNCTEILHCIGMSQRGQTDPSEPTLQPSKVIQ